MPLIVTGFAIILLIILISVVRLNTFISLIVVSTIAAIGLGIPLENVPSILEKGMGSTLGHITLIFGLGAMLGRVLSFSGGAKQIAERLTELFGAKHIRGAIIAASFIIGISMFFEVGLVLLLPIIFSIAKELSINPYKLGLPMLATLLTTHCFLPPHPGPTIIATEYGADVGAVLLYGIAIAIPTVYITGNLFSRLIAKVSPQTFSRPSSHSEEEDTSIKSDQDRPHFLLSLLVALLPVILIISSTIARTLANLWHISESHFIVQYIEFIGTPSGAMIISLLFAIFTLVILRGKSMKTTMNALSNSVASISMMLFITGAGGALKETFLAGGVGDYINQLFASSSISPLIFAWAIAAILRISLGAATVAGLSAIGIVMPILGNHDVNLALLALATGAGSTIASHVNDPGFWIVKEYFGLSLKDMFKTWTLMSTIASICGLIGVLVINAIIG